MRPLTAVSQVAAKHTASVRIAKEGQWVDGKSAWDMMLLISPPGTTLTIEADGPDAAEALAAVLAELQRWAELDAAADAAVQG
jgi:phosphocarrier protein